jgi:hypothetical protein
MADIANETDNAPEPTPAAVPPIDVAPSSTGVVADEHPEDLEPKTEPSREHTGL